MKNRGLRKNLFHILSGIELKGYPIKKEVFITILIYTEYIVGISNLINRMI